MMKHLSIPLLTFAILGFMLVGAGAICAQEVSIGIKGGFVLTDDMQYASRGGSESDRGEIGPAFELKWASGFAVETALLYRRVGYNSVSYWLPSDVSRQLRAKSWEIPIAAKYYFAAQDIDARPFITGGYVLRALSGAIEESQTYSYPEYEPVHYRGEANVKNSVSPGLMVGGGIQFDFGRIRFSPEFSYTRWLSLPFDEEGSKGYRVRSAANQMNFRMSLSFVTRKAAKVQ